MSGSSADADATAGDGWAQAYLEARARTKPGRRVEVVVLRDASSRDIVCYGPPERWPAGTALQVLTDKYSLDVLRCAGDGPWGFVGQADGVEAAAPPPMLSAPRGRSILSRGGLSRLKVGVHAHRGGCAYMEDESTVHVTANGDTAFICVYDGHGGGEASKYCKEVRRSAPGASSCLLRLSRTRILHLLARAARAPPPPCTCSPACAADCLACRLPLCVQVLHLNVMGTAAYSRAMSSHQSAQADADSERALRDGFLKTDDELLARQLGAIQILQQEQVHHANEQLIQLQLQEALARASAGQGGRSRSRRGTRSLSKEVLDPPHDEAGAPSVGGAAHGGAGGGAIAARERAVIRLTQPPPPPPGGCCGSTALVLMLRVDDGGREHLHVAWLGDCRAVLCRSGVAEVLTREHSVSVESERRRVLREGGEVEAGRLSGFLQVSRALGDLDCDTRRKPAGLTGEPELSSRQIQPQDEFVIVGTDGLWECISTADAV